ncbi:iron hydrogenase [Patescibacteria group bacterium]|nr:iron hydrogenase [Patescibacteria group bacterium]
MKSIAKIIDTTQSKILLFAGLLGLSIAVPAFIHIQWVTGPMVNTALILATVLIGPMEAVLIGLMPSTIALVAGLLPLPLAPMVPFIMIGNAVLVAVFHYLYKKHFLLAVGIAAFLKFAFLHESVTLIMSKLLKQEIVAKLAVMMSWPQFFTAVIGGGVAFFILKWKKN